MSELENAYREALKTIAKKADVSEIPITSSKMGVGVLILNSIKDIANEALKKGFKKCKVCGKLYEYAMCECWDDETLQ